MFINSLIPWKLQVSIFLKILVKFKKIAKCDQNSIICFGKNHQSILNLCDLCNYKAKAKLELKRQILEVRLLY